MGICFLSSGVLHEYVLLLISYTIHNNNNKLSEEMIHSSNNKDSNMMMMDNKKYYYNYEPNYGNQLLFFIWNGILILLENSIGHFKIFQWIKSSFPNYILTFLVLSLSLPIAHLFTDEYVNSGFYTHFKVGF